MGKLNKKAILVLDLDGTSFTNPRQQKLLIEFACQHHGGVIFITAGAYDEVRIKQHLINSLTLSTNTAKAISNSAFLSTNTAQALNKSQLLEKYIEDHPALTNTPFVVIDDGHYQFNSNKNNIQVVRADATKKGHIASSMLYHLVSEALNNAKTKATTFVFGYVRALETAPIKYPTNQSLKRKYEQVDKAIQESFKIEGGKIRLFPSQRLAKTALEESTSQLALAIN